MHCNTCCSINHVFYMLQSKNMPFFMKSPHCSTLQHEASILKELDAMLPDEFRTELRDSLIDFYDPQEILRPVAKPLICNFVAMKAAPVSDAAQAPSGDAVVANNVEDPSAAFIDPARLHRRQSLRRKPRARPCRRR